MASSIANAFQCANPRNLSHCALWPQCESLLNYIRLGGCCRTCAPSQLRLERTNSKSGRVGILRPTEMWLRRETCSGRSDVRHPLPQALSGNAATLSAHTILDQRLRAYVGKSHFECALPRHAADPPVHTWASDHTAIGSESPFRDVCHLTMSHQENWP